MSGAGSACHTSEGLRSTTMQHVPCAAVKSFETLQSAQALYMNSMRIPLDPIEPTTLTPVAISYEEPLRVELRIDVSNWTTAQHTLTLHLAPDCVKRFVFKPVFNKIPQRELGAEDDSTTLKCAVDWGNSVDGMLKIPCSVRRPTNLEIRCYSDGNELPAAKARSLLHDTATSNKTVLAPSVTFAGPPERYRVMTGIRHEQKAFTFPFHCYAYEAEESMPIARDTGYSISHAFNDFQAILAKPLITPSHTVSVVSAKAAEAMIADLEKSISQLQQTFDKTFLDTARRELGAGEQAIDVQCAVDWGRSHTVAVDSTVQAIMSNAKDLYTQITALSNTAVESSWLQDEEIQDVVQCRKQLSDSVRGRRTDLEQVVRVRSKFLCIDSIDSMLRAVCSFDTELCKTDELSSMLQMPCHLYWLQQMKANYSNSVALDQESYMLASNVINKCISARAGRQLLPHTDVIKSSLGFIVWQSMHLQGLVATHALPLAPCAHFMYKRRARVDYSAHPVVQQAPSPALAMLTMLVSTDVEHRIIPPILCSHILTLLEKTTGNGATETAKSEASSFLKRVFHPKLHSLLESALQGPSNTEPPDLSFITSATYEASTGYDMDEVTNFCLQSVFADKE